MNHQWKTAIIKHGKIKSIVFLTALSMAASVAVTALVNSAFGYPFGPVSLIVSLAVPLVLSPAIGIIHVSLIIELHEAEARAIESAAVDSLTGLSNRKAFAESAAAALGLGARNGFEVSLIYLDLDHFKRINDTFGHGTGDRVLEQFAALLKTSIRKTDIIGRIGGEEFAVVLNDSSLGDASRLAENIRRNVERTEFRAEDGQSLGMTVSAGVASSGTKDEAALENLMTRADRSLYQAKKTGRNRIHVCDPKHEQGRTERDGRTVLALGTAV